MADDMASEADEAATPDRLRRIRDRLSKALYRRWRPDTAGKVRTA